MMPPKTLTGLRWFKGPVTSFAQLQTSRRVASDAIKRARELAKNKATELVNQG
jgi:hypothetical protein